MGYQSEAELERLLIEQLVNQGYTKVKIDNEDDLRANLREMLSIFNYEKLGYKELTDKEFERIERYLEGKSVYKSAKILRDKFILERGDGSEVYIEFFDSKNWCQNLFQVTSQVTMVSKYVNRYDVTILMNGFPVIQIELKRRGIDLKEAFNQIERYRKHSFTGLYRYAQVMIISNGVDTKYFANSDRKFMYSQTFFWSDEENNRISSLKEFTQSFLDKCFAAKIIARYMVINDTDKMLMVMRPYQIYAVEKLINRALETNNNGYIWHTTGSGKTLTSFKVSQILSNEPGIKKVFFLVDRKDLDSQTLEEFNKFEKDSVDTTDKTSTLVKQIKDVTKPLIVTTIQKMANAINSPQYSVIMEKYREDKVVFIIDECHRSQFGDMHKAINKHFVNAQYFGFTGTPRFLENKSQDGRVTADLFEKCLHSYLIKDAINDGNVLGFSVEYVKTFSGQYDENDEEKVSGIDTDEVYMNDERIALIADNIIKNHSAKTRNREYTAIFTVQNIPMLVKYYDEFKKINHNLNITGIFTYGANEESEGRDEHSRDSLERIISDYNKMFDTNYSTDTFSSYFSDVSKKVKTAQIDILIVVNMFLTGFDSKTLNTLYVDKNLKYHDLIQAYSRTNRIEKSTKPYGNIVCFRNLKKNTDEAIRLFSQTNNTDTVLMDSYENYLEKFKKQLNILFNIAETPEAVGLLEREEDKKEFIIAFRELSKILVKLQTFNDFEFTEDVTGLSEQSYQDFKSKYFLIYDETKKSEGEKVSILDDIDFGIELMHTDKINVSYIMELIRNIDLSDKKKRDKDIHHIKQQLDRADNEELRLKIDLIKNFLDKVIPDLKPEESIDDAYSDFEEEERKKEIKEFSYEVGVSEDVIYEHISEYEFSGIIDNEAMSDEIKAPLLKKRKILKTMKDFIKAHVRRFE
ncbi:type I restriction endonuclease subunit R [Clostridium neonatale]|uniref:type I restriction endonuclease subunit R n=1 Tax=Clostridium neonatale TaxID=137838 RepID=UPI00291BAB03|nr:type I restriction endonuclease subunit R [Clostridium neonatale]CAI3721722.1 Type-1 restriction enzyme R protein [Clostridium neonatale]CAI3724913.1 Type-1 restriction enzyme R protein [Clostridium neonatale]